MMKTVLFSLFTLLVLGLSAQTPTGTDTLKYDSTEVLLIDTASTFNDKTASATLRRIWPEPFYDFLQFDFNVFDCTEHGVEIKIVNSQNELVYSTIVQLCEGHENLRISTVDFFMVGIYSIQVKIDGKYQYYRSFKRTKF